MVSRRRGMRMWAALTLVVLMVALIGAGASAQDEESDDRARVSFVVPLIDDDGQLWFKVGFHTPWADKPPRDLFSFFFFLDVIIDGESSSIGWQVHDEAENAIEDGATTENPQAYILESGCVLVATGIVPEDGASVSVNAAWGSWVDETTSQAIFGGEELGVDLASAEHGDPFEAFGPVVFNLANGEMIIPTTTSTAAPTTSSTAAPTTSSTAAPTTSSTVDSSTTATTGVVAIAEGGDPWFLWSIFILLFFGLLAWLLIFFLQWWVPPFMDPWVGRYGRKVTDGLKTPPPKKGEEERPTIPEEEPDTGGTTTTGTTTDTETTGTDKPETTRDTEDGGGTGTGPDPAPDREPTKPDCTPLRVECERLRAEATRLDLEANDAEAQEEQAWDACREADTRQANLQGKIAELMARDDAPQLYLRIAEAQIDFRAAEATMEALCSAAEALEGVAAAARAAAESAKAAADAACQAADECEAANG